MSGPFPLLRLGVAFVCATMLIVTLGKLDYHIFVLHDAYVEST